MWAQSDLSSCQQETSTNVGGLGVGDDNYFVASQVQVRNYLALVKERERELFSLVFPDPLTRTASIIYWATRQYVAQEMDSN